MLRPWGGFCLLWACGRMGYWTERACEYIGICLAARCCQSCLMVSFNGKLVSSGIYVGQAMSTIEILSYTQPDAR